MMMTVLSESNVALSYALASSTWDEQEHEALQRVIASGNYTMGEHVAAFEQAFAQAMGSRYAIMVNSGSSANLLMVAALFYTETNRLQRGDEVIVPAVSWATTYFPLSQYGLVLKFVDIDPDTLNYDLKALESAISEKTRLIMAVNLLGNPNDFGQIQQLISNKPIRLIEDNCESLGASFQGKKAGTFGVMGTYSSFFSHHISTMEGGLIVTDDEELAHILICLRSHGWTRHLPQQNRVTGSKSDDAFEESFKFVLPGYNVRPGELHGALGLAQLAKLPELIRVRRANAAYFQSRFLNHPTLRIQKEVGESSWFGFSIILKPEASFSRSTLIQALKSARIECRPIVSGNFTKNAALQWCEYSVHNTLPHADWLDSNGLFVGNHHYDIRSQIDYLAEVVSTLAQR
jgi:CDP-4-dehydro-6-deoxyglucose reductase, E1